MGKALADHRRNGAAPAAGSNAALLECDAAERRRAHQQRLLQDQQERRRHDVAAIAAGRIEQRLVQDLHRRAAGERGAIEAAIRTGAAGREIRPDLADGFLNALERAVVEQEIGGIDVGREPRLSALQHLALGSGRNAQDAEYLAPGERGLRFGERGRSKRHLDGLVGSRRPG